MTEDVMFVERLRRLAAEAEASLMVADSEELEAWRVHYLGRKGALALAMRTLGRLNSEERPEAGIEANKAKTRLEALYDERVERMRRARLSEEIQSEAIDVSLPGRAPTIGYAHPLRTTTERIMRIFGEMGFSVIEGPEVEWERYNFDLLNIPADHPSRDPLETFYIDQAVGLLLRVHTSPVQARTMERREPPIRVIVPGAAYRRDAEDASHLSDFSQCEGLAIDKDITFADLKGTLAEFARRIFGARVRFRPHHFPFTEPSAEVDFSCTVCGGGGCRTCKYEGWLEVLGCGMVHPQVLRNVGYDPAVYSGFAFGMGLERIALLTYGIPDIRLLYSNDMRFLEQFA